MGKDKLKAVADRRYYTGAQIRACHDAGIATILPKPTTSNAKAEGRFDKADFIYIARDDEYQCPAGQRAIYRFSEEDKGLLLRRYWSSACPRCPMKAQCTPSAYRKISRWEHETVLEAVQRRLDKQPEAMTLRRRTVEHVFGTLKHWMGSTHFLTRTLANVSTENEPACAGLQPNESDEHPGARQDDEGDEVARRVSASASLTGFNSTLRAQR